MKRLAILSMWVAAMAGVVGIIATHCGCDDVAIRMAYVGGCGYTTAAVCVWRIVANDGG